MIWLGVNRDLFTAESPHFISRNSTFDDRFFVGGLPWLRARQETTQAEALLKHG